MNDLMTLTSPAGKKCFFFSLHKKTFSMASLEHLLEHVVTDGAESIFDALRKKSYWNAGDSNNCKSNMFYCVTHSEMDCLGRFKAALGETTSEEELANLTETFIARPTMKDVLTGFEDDDVKRRKETGIQNVYAKIEKIDTDYSQSIAKHSNKKHFIQHVLMGMQARNEFVGLAYGRMYEKDEPHENRIEFFKKLDCTRAIDRYSLVGTYERLCYMMQNYNKWLSARMTLFLSLLDGREAEVYLNYAPLGRRSFDSGPEWISFHRLLADVGETWSGPRGQNQSRSVYRIADLANDHLRFYPPYNEGGVFPEMLFPMTIKFNVQVKVDAIPQESTLVIANLFKENFVKVFSEYEEYEYKAFAHTTVSVSLGISKLIFTISFGVEDVPLLGRDSEEKNDPLRTKINEALNQMANLDRGNFTAFERKGGTRDAAEKFWAESYEYGGLAWVLQPLVDLQIDDDDIADKTMDLPYKLPYLTDRSSKEILNIEKAATNMLKNAQDFIGKTIYPGYSNNQGAVIKVGDNRYVAMSHSYRDTSGWLHDVGGKESDVNARGTLKSLQAALNNKAGVSGARGGGGGSKRSGPAPEMAASASGKRARSKKTDVLDVDQDQSGKVCGTFEDKNQALLVMKGASGKSKLNNVENRIRFLFKDANGSLMHRVPVPTYMNEKFTRSFASSFAFAALLMREFDIHAAIMQNPNLLNVVSVDDLKDPEYWIEQYKEVCDLLKTKGIDVQICVNYGTGRDKKVRKQILYPRKVNEGAKVFSFFMINSRGSSLIYEPLIPETELRKFDDSLLRPLTITDNQVQEYKKGGFSEMAIRLAIIGENKGKRDRLLSKLHYHYNSPIVVNYKEYYPTSAKENGNDDNDDNNPFAYRGDDSYQSD